MLIVYDRNTNQIVGHCSRVFDSGKWREATIEEIFPDRDRSNLASVYVSDDARFIAYGADAWRLSKDPSGIITGIERKPAIKLSCDAADHDGDGIPDLPADGTSVTRITAQIDEQADVDVAFRTTRGSLSQRTVRTKKGQAIVELRAANETVAVTVTATAAGYRQGRLNLEFIPLK